MREIQGESRIRTRMMGSSHQWGQEISKFLETCYLYHKNYFVKIGMDGGAKSVVEFSAQHCVCHILGSHDWFSRKTPDRRTDWPTGGRRDRAGPISNISSKLVNPPHSLLWSQNLNHTICKRLTYFSRHWYLVVGRIRVNVARKHTIPGIPKLFTELLRINS